MESPDSAAPESMQAAFAEMEKVAVATPLVRRMEAAAEAMLAVTAAIQALTVSIETAQVDAADESLQIAAEAMHTAIIAVPTKDVRQAAAFVLTLSILAKTPAEFVQRIAVALKQDGLLNAQTKKKVARVNTVEAALVNAQKIAVIKLNAIHGRLSEAAETISVLSIVSESARAGPIGLGQAADLTTAMIRAESAKGSAGDTDLRTNLASVKSKLAVMQDNAASFREIICTTANLGIKNVDGRAKSRRFRRRASEEKTEEWQQLADKIWARDPGMAVRPVARQVVNQYPLESRPSLETVRRRIQPPITPKNPTKKKSRN